MALFSYAPSFEAAEVSKPDVRKFQAGDGYEHRIRFGLSTDAKEWNLVFDKRTEAERDRILGFFERHYGEDAFDWESPRGIIGKYVCESWKNTIVAYNNNTITATFRQVFER